jgi:hypothetical protein
MALPTRSIAAVLGPALIAVTVSETINLRIWDSVDPTLVYLNGLFFLVGGLVVVTNHTRWHPLKAVPVTLAGWLLVFAGLWRMFFPAAPQATPGVATYVGIGVLCVLGLVISATALGRD